MIYSRLINVNKKIWLLIVIVKLIITLGVLHTVRMQERLQISGKERGD